MKLFLRIACLTLLPAIAFAQTTLRGSILEQFNNQPIPGVVILLQGPTAAAPLVSSPSGLFRFDGLAPGRYTITTQLLGYQPTTQQVVLTAGKEQVLRLLLNETIAQLNEVVVTSKSDGSRPTNELVLVSGRSFNADDTRRYAGSLNDPSRMVANYAGVSGANDARNDIVIRGNSPAGLLWRLEGIDIPNPNHFGALGTTGGPVSMLNNNLLGTSDFLTGAFPAAYGNALSGVFDISLRQGNNEKREYVAQIGFNGVELGAEGPFANQKGSYLINYRYSTLSVLKAVGVNIGTGAAIPEYQDVSFKFSLPTKKSGTFQLFGLAGDSYIELLAEKDAADNLYALTGRDTYFGSRSAVFGASHTILLPNNWLSKVAVAYTHAQQKTRVDSIITATEARTDFFGDRLSESRVTAHWQLSKKFNAKNYVQWGLIGNALFFEMRDSVFIADRFFPRRDEMGTTQLAQGYGQWQHHFNNRLTFTGGLHAQYLALNGAYRIEPRTAVRWQFVPGQFLNAAVGRHSQAQPLALLFFKDPRAIQSSAYTNKDLQFSQSDQVVVGWERRNGSPWSIKTEVYYQSLSGIPVSATHPTFSMVNTGADFGVPGLAGLTNAGTGRNFGAELTLERSFANNFYLLATTSVFDAKYQGADKKWHNTAFNGHFVNNLLAGKEITIKEKYLLSFDGKVTWAGGRRYTPIDLEASRRQGSTVRLNNQPFSAQFSDYFRADLRITFRMNGKKTMQEWAMDFQNLTNRRNVFMNDFAPATGNIFTSYQVGFFPMMFYRFYF